MFQIPKNELRVTTSYRPAMREVMAAMGATESNLADAFFKHPAVKVWRSLDDRENATLEATLTNGRKIRWHVKRYPAQRGFYLPADEEERGYRCLTIERIPTAPLVAWGKMMDRRSIVIFDDLTGHTPADKLLERGEATFDQLLAPTAELAGALHARGLHHRDLYLCHFLAKIEPHWVDVKLIDTARVKRLPGVLTRRRWVVKDLAQFWYSTTRRPQVTDAHRDAWLAEYAQAAGEKNVARLKRSVLRKAAWIARHDKKLSAEQPGRHVSIPSNPCQ